MKRPAKAEIAASLGVSPAAFSRYLRRGCPSFSVEAARTWQAANVDPSQRRYRDLRRTDGAAGTVDELEALLQQVADLGARHAIDTMLGNQAVAAAALVRFGEVPLEQAINLAAIVCHAQHSLLKSLLDVDDAKLNALPRIHKGGMPFSFARQCAELERQAEQFIVDVPILAAELWPSAETSGGA